MTSRFRVRRFDADRTDREITLQEALSSRPGERQLLWIDIGGAIDDERLAALAERFELEPQARDTLAEPRRRPQLSMHGACVDPCVAATPGHSLTKSPIWLEIVAGRSFVITRRDADVGHDRRPQGGHEALRDGRRRRLRRVARRSSARSTST